MTDSFDPLGNVVIQNDTDFDDNTIMQALRDQHESLVAALTDWGNSVQRSYTPPSRAGGLWERDRYVTPASIFDQMRLAYEAVESDDVVAGVAESTESLAFNKVGFYANDEDEEDIYNQVAADINLDARLRECWRELFVVSQFAMGIWWTNKTYTVRGKTGKGTKRKRQFTIRCPRALTLLDPLKIIPVGSTLFNQERLAYFADRGEAEEFDRVLDRSSDDQIISRFIVGRYEPTTYERRWLGELQIDSSNLFLLNPVNVFRHTATRPQFNRFAAVRMRSIFQLLDLKQQLRQQDRAFLLGGLNFLILVKKGSDAQPASAAELRNLSSQMQVMTRLPVMVGDHRLSVEIVAPPQDQVLKSEKYNVIDSRITARLYQMFVLGGGGVGARDDSVKLVKVIGRGMESRRHMMSRSLMEFVFTPMFEANDNLTTPPRMRFQPHQIALDFDANFASFLLDLRESNELSRETILSQFDMDQSDEAQMLERERELYDKIFLTQQPFSAPNPALNPALNPGIGNPGNQEQPMSPAEQKRQARRGGGNRNGGGVAPGSGQGLAPRRVRRKSDGGETSGDS